MATAQGTKPLSSKTVETMKSGDKYKADAGQNTLEQIRRQGRCPGTEASELQKQAKEQE